MRINQYICNVCEAPLQSPPPAFGLMRRRGDKAGDGKVLLTAHLCEQHEAEVVRVLADTFRFERPNPRSVAGGRASRRAGVHINNVLTQQNGA